MSHEMLGIDGRVVYTMPALPSDVLRLREFEHFFRDYRGPTFSVQTKDGWSWSSSSGHPEFTATFSTCAELDAVIDDSTEGALSRMFLEGNLDVQGELFVLLSVAEYVLRHASGLSGNLIHAIRRASLHWMKGLRISHRSSAAPWRLNSCLASLPVDFFQPWLGPSLGHFCARFRNPREALEDAQQHAIKQVCSDLKLEEHDRFLDMNCGWGSVLIYATGEYGVRGQGMAFSGQQAATILDRLRQRNLHRRCTVECRNSAEPLTIGSRFEKIVDIGLFDQVAPLCFRSYLEYASDALTPGGILLMHRTTRRPGASGKGGEVPHLESSGCGELPLLSSELQVAESFGYQILNVEDLSEDYGLTLRHWIERIRCCETPLAETPKRQFRSWFFCLLETAAKLDVGEIQLQQLRLRRATAS